MVKRSNGQCAIRIDNISGPVLNSRFTKRQGREGLGEDNTALQCHTIHTAYHPEKLHAMKNGPCSCCGRPFMTSPTCSASETMWHKKFSWPQPTLFNMKKKCLYDPSTSNFLFQHLCSVLWYSCSFRNKKLQKFALSKASQSTGAHSSKQSMLHVPCLSIHFLVRTQMHGGHICMASVTQMHHTLWDFFTSTTEGVTAVGTAL